MEQRILEDDRCRKLKSSFICTSGIRILSDLKELCPEDLWLPLYMSALFGDKERDPPAPLKARVYRCGDRASFSCFGASRGAFSRGPFLVALSLLGLSPRTAVMLSLVPLAFYVCML